MTIPNKLIVVMDVDPSEGNIGVAVDDKINEIYGDQVHTKQLVFRITIEIIDQRVPTMLPTMNEAGRTIDTCMEAYEKMFGAASGIPARYLDPNDYKK